MEKLHAPCRIMAVQQQRVQVQSAMQVCVADTVVSLVLMGPGRLGAGTEFERFITRTLRVHLPVTVHVVPTPISGSGRCLFNSMQGLKVFHSGKGYVIDCQRRSTHRQLVFSTSSCSASIYFVGWREKDNRCIYPLYQPIGKILIFLYSLNFSNGLLVHSSCVIQGNRAILFVGGDGYGKSTLVQVCSDYSIAEPLSDDQTIVRKIPDGIFAYGTPWQGEDRYRIPERYHLDRIIFISHGMKNSVRRLDQKEALIRLLPQLGCAFWDALLTQRTMELAEEVVQGLPCWELKFNLTETLITFLIELLHKA